MNGRNMYESFEIVENEYGKASVRMLHLRREGIVHTIREFEVDTSLTLDDTKDYTKGDNEDIIATDSQKNTVYLLAKRHGVTDPERFAMLLAEHFLAEYSWVLAAKIGVRMHPWERMRVEDGIHNHAFISNPVYERFTTVLLRRGAEIKVTSGLRNMRIIKTTQSSFSNFVDDAYRTLPDTNDRIASTIVQSHWNYSPAAAKFCYDKAFDLVKSTICEVWAGPAKHGIHSASLQKTLYDTERLVLERVPQVTKIHMALPNAHYFAVDLSKFPSPVGGTRFNDEVFQPVDKPSGFIQAALSRSDLRSRL